MTADLITRARSAETRDEECAVIRDAIYQFITDGDTALALLGIIVAVLSGRAPRAVLLGVVAALVPEGRQWAANKWPDDGGYGSAVVLSDDGGEVEVDSPTPALALLIAIL